MKFINMYIELNQERKGIILINKILETQNNLLPCFSSTKCKARIHTYVHNVQQGMLRTKVKKSKDLSEHTTLNTMIFSSYASLFLVPCSLLTYIYKLTLCFAFLQTSIRAVCTLRLWKTCCLNNSKVFFMCSYSFRSISFKVFGQG